MLYDKLLTYLRDKIPSTILYLPNGPVLISNTSYRLLVAQYPDGIYLLDRMFKVDLADPNMLQDVLSLLDAFTNRFPNSNFGLKL